MLQTTKIQIAIQINIAIITKLNMFTRKREGKFLKIK